jgi:hypothetical protein
MRVSNKTLLMLAWAGDLAARRVLLRNRCVPGYVVFRQFYDGFAIES